MLQPITKQPTTLPTQRKGHKIEIKIHLCGSSVKGTGLGTCSTLLS